MCAAALGEKSVRVGEKDASLARSDTRLGSSPFLAFHRVLVLLSLPVGRCRSRRGSVLGDYPPLQSKGNTLGVVGPWHPHFPPWVPYPPRRPAPFTSPAPSAGWGAWRGAPGDRRSWPSRSFWPG